MREVYFGTIRYLHPVAGNVQLLAESEEHAREILEKAHAEMKNFEIVDLQKMTKEDLQALVPQYAFDFDVDKDKLN